MKRICTVMIALVLVLSLFAPAMAEPVTKTIAFCAPYANHQAWQVIKEGAMDAGEYFSNDEVKYEVIWTGPSTMGDAVQMVEIMETFIADKVDSIVFCPEVESAFFNICADMKEAGIPVYTFAADMISDPTLRTAYIGTSNYDVGRQQIESMHKAIGTDDLKVCIVMSSLEAGNQVTQVQAITDYIEELKAKGADAEILEIRDDKGGVDSTYVYDVFAGMLMAYPECNVLLSTHGNTAPLQAKAIEETGNAGKVVASSYDEAPECLDCIRNGRTHSLMCQNFYGWGFGPVAVAVEKLEGREVKDFYDAGCVTVTQENIDTYSEEFSKLADVFKELS